jgi:hypothetical protein
MSIYFIMDVLQWLCMAEQNPEIIEQEIAALEEQLAAKRAELGQDTETPYERAEVHEALGERMGPEGVAPAATPPPTPAPATPTTDGASWQDPALAGQVQELVNVAFTQGVQVAIDQALKTHNAALVDALHDILSDELHQQLVERGQVKAAA